MGLDVRVLVNLRRIERELTDEELEDEEIVVLNNPYLKERGGNVPEGNYFYERHPSFRAGSYSGYGAWRRSLSHLMLNVAPETIWDKPEDFKGKPFVELINFSDCEGYLGTDVCAKLAKDFEDHRGKVPAKTGNWEEDYFAEKYETWAKSLKLVAENNGVLDFC
jgi:hypothetical protein